jgi:hypothetical protein
MRTAKTRSATGALCAVAALVSVSLIAACGSDDGDDTDSPTNGGSQARGHLMKQTIPGQIDEKPHGFVSSYLVRPVVNAWRVSSRRRLTEVDAGAVGDDHSTGVLAIFRQDFVSAHQSTNLVKVKDSGPLRIARAPVGRGAEESAQRTAEIEFVGERGVRGTLRLRDDSIRLDTSSGSPAD